MNHAEKSNPHSEGVDHDNPIKVSFERLQELGIKVFVLDPNRVNPNTAEARFREFDQQRDAKLIEKIM